MTTEPAQTPNVLADYPHGSMLRGVGFSLLLHGVIVGLLVLAFLSRQDVDDLYVLIFPVDLVAAGPDAKSPAAPNQAAVPQQKATERTPTPQPAAVPDVGAKEKQTAATPASSVRDGERSEPKAKTENDLDARLQQLARLHTSAPPSPANQDGPGFSNVTLASGTANGDMAVYRVKDFLRTQIERRWYVDLSQVPPGHVIVSLHLLLNPDGALRNVDVVHHKDEVDDRKTAEFIQSARNAALLSSPFTLPPNSYEIAKDIVIDLDARQLAR
jgi:hypothetical protein